MTNLLNFDSNQNYISDCQICNLNLNSIDSNIDIKIDNYIFLIPDNYLNIVYNNAQELFLVSKDNSKLLNFDSRILNNTIQNSEMGNDNKKIIDKITKENIQKEIKEKKISKENKI